MAISKIILNGVSQMDLTQDTVADASHIRSGFTGHLNDGTSATGSYSGTSPTLTTKSITANGTYNASSDNADGYSSVTVNVPAPVPFGMTLDWADVQEVTIGENSVKNGSEMQSYLSSYTYTFLILKDAVTVNNQLVFAGSNNLGTSINSAYRYRNNTIGSFGITASYDCKLVEGSVYYAITKKTS